LKYLNGENTLSGSKKSLKQSDKKLLISNHLYSKGKKRATARRKRRKLRVVSEHQTS
jgi:hypothetical protein